MSKINSNKMFLTAISIVLFIIILFSVLDYFMSKKEQENWLSGGDWITIIIGAISSVSTIFLGYISYWQNKKQREDNLKSEHQMRIQHQNEKDDLLLQHKIDTLTIGLNIYMERLHHIDVKLSERNFACDILEYTYKLEEHKNLND